MQKVVNLINFTGWSFILFHVSLQLLIDPIAWKTADISLDVFILKLLQTFAGLSELILILLRVSKGNLIASFFQNLGRLSVALYYTSNETDRLSFAIMVIMWSISDANRSLFYLFKSPITALMRYNMFIVLYPVGVYGEMCVMNDFIKIHAQTISHELIVFTRCGQAAIIAGLIILYNYMLGVRRIKAKDNYGFQV